MNSKLARVVETKALAIEGTDQIVRALCYHLVVNDEVGFDIYVDAEEKDEITEAITSQIYTFPRSFWLLAALLKPGQSVLDLGAHIGTFSLFAAALGYKVVSVEASSRNAALLKAGTCKNGFDNVQVITAAIFDQVGTLEFVQAGPYGLIASPLLDAPTVSVSAITTDRLLADIGWESVDFIKMDVEGAEVAAIRGMPRLLSRDDAPMILYESNGHTLHYSGETPGSLMAALEESGYQSYLVESGRFIPARSTDLQPEVCVDYLATKRPLDTLVDWRVAAPMSDEERITRILFSSVHPNKYARDYIARALTSADASILSDPRVVDALENSNLDQDGIVRVRERYQALLEKEAGIAHLRELVEGYTRSWLNRMMQTLNHLWRKVKYHVR
jgi:FkbM family methyltransferase